MKELDLFPVPKHLINYDQKCEDSIILCLIVIK